jgi:hypothetical protein
VLGCLEKMMRETGFDARQISLQTREFEGNMFCWLYGRLGQELKLSSMQLESVDLLMMECMRADESSGAEKSFPCKSEPRVCRDRTVFVEPGTDSALGDLRMISTRCVSVLE